MRMKKTGLPAIAVLSLLGLLAVLTLLAPQLLREREDGRLLALSVLLRDTDSSGWNAARQGMEQAADELGAELRWLTLTVPNDTREQEELLRREAEGGADAVIAVPADPEALRSALDRLAAPCPVVTLECAMKGSAGTAAPDNGEVGRRLAEALLEDWSGGDVLLLDNSGDCPETAPRLEAALEALTAAGVPAVRGTALPEDAPPAWVMTFEDGATRRAAAGKEGADGFALYGVGASTAVTAQLERGAIAAVAAWSDYAAGYLAVRQAVQALRERSRPLDPLPFSIVRGEDIYAPENQKLLFPVTS